MKREGRQHGAVSCYQIFPNLSSQQRYAKMVDSAASSTMGGLFAKVPTNKPTNQSKYTGKCGKPRCNRCRVHPVCKSKDKAKRSMKKNNRTIDVENELSNYAFGASATGVLAYLVDDNGGGYGNDHDYDYDYDYGYDYQDRVEEKYDHTYYDYEYTHDHDHSANRVGFEIEMDGSLEADEGDNEDKDETDDDAMSFCDVGLCWGHEEGEEEYGDDDDGWYLVGGQM